MTSFHYNMSQIWSVHDFGITKTYCLPTINFRLPWLLPP